jgi:hypothetical protein
MRILLVTITAALAIAPAFAQHYEFGAFGGGSFYSSSTITNPKGNADAGFSSGFSGGGYIGGNMYDHIGGELRYTYLHNDMTLKSGSQSATFGGQAHALHYDFLVHATGRESKIRPYVAAGGGMKFYQGTGDEIPFQPLSNIGLLTKTSQVGALVSVGAGVKVQFSSRIMFRVDIHDYLSPFPDKVIAPALNSTTGGWLNNIVPTAGVSVTF